MSTLLSRRTFLVGVGAAGAAASGGPAVSAASMRVGYAAITWGGDDERAIREVGDVGFRGIQLRNSAVDRWGRAPSELRRLLAEKNLTLVALSSGNLRIDPSLEREELATHAAHATFVHDVGGLYLQVIDERPKGRAIVAEDYQRLGRVMTELGKRTADVGVPLVYHHHMNSLGEAPHEIDAILDATDARHVGVLFDIAHYRQGGGDPAAAIRRYGDRIRVVHLKDVRTIGAAPGYQWVELGRGRVDVGGAVAALKDIGFSGWAIIELDRVPDPGGSPKASAMLNKDYAEHQLGLNP
jgi:inosose dehydratase